MQQPVDTPDRLSRSLGFWALCFYGIGDILGAGIYALVGKVAGAAGAWGAGSFLVAMVIAGLTGLSYCELVSRHPYAAGEAQYVLHAFRRPRFAFLVGWMVFCSGLISMSAATHASADYVRSLAPHTPGWLVWLLFLAALAALNLLGIRTSSSVNIVFTLIEASGLFLVIGAGLIYLGSDPPAVEAAAVPPVPRDLTGVFQGAVLAFFAYIGFEDMINVAEEVDAPTRVFPRAILCAVVICSTIYVAVYLVATAVVPPAELAHSDAPLLAVVRRAAPGVPPALYVLIALIAVGNTALLNFIMASRLIYGMSSRGLLPSWLQAVHPRTRTPHRAVLTVLIVAIMLVCSGTLKTLAQTTSLLLLVVFACVNLSLIRIRAEFPAADGIFRTPRAVPWLGAGTSLGLLAFLDGAPWLLGGGVIACGLLISWFAAGRRVRMLP